MPRIEFYVLSSNDAVGRLRAACQLALKAWSAEALPITVASSVGAGDSFVGALVWSLQQGQALPEAFTWAMAAGSAALLTPGTGLCLPDDVRRLRPQGRLVMNFVTLENLATATQALQSLNADWDVLQLQAARSRPILHMHRMAAENPVWLVCAGVGPMSRDQTEPLVAEETAHG